MVQFEEEIIEPELLPKIPAIEQTMETAREELAKLNARFGTSVGLKFVPVEYLKRHDYLKTTYMGFVRRDEPFHLYIVPQNIFTPVQCQKTVRHEFKHVLDLTCNPDTDADCPIGLNSKQREDRANAFENVALAKTASLESINCPVCEMVNDRGRRKLIETMRELQAAEQHLSQLDVGLTKRVRELRKRLETHLWPNYDTGD